MTAQPIKWITPFDGVPVKIDASWFFIFKSTASALVEHGDERFKTEFLERLVFECDAVLSKVPERGAGQQPAKDRRGAKRKLAPQEVEEILASKMTQRELARAHGISRGTIRNVKTGRYYISQRNKEALRYAGEEHRRNREDVRRLELLSIIEDVYLDGDDTPEKIGVLYGDEPLANEDERADLIANSLTGIFNS